MKRWIKTLGKGLYSSIYTRPYHMVYLLSNWGVLLIVNTDNPETNPQPLGKGKRSIYYTERQLVHDLIICTAANSAQ